MLDSIRKRKENFFYTGIIIVTAGVMLFFGVGGNDSDTKGNGPVAWVNGEIITTRDYQQAVQNMYMQYAQMLGNQYDEKLLKAFNLEGRALDELVKQRLIAQEADRLHVNVTDKELQDYIRSLPYFQTKEGKFDFEAYKKLPNPGQREKEMRAGLQRQKLQEFVLGRVRLTPAELKQGFLLKNTKADVEYAKIDFNSLAPNPKISAGETEKYLKNAAAEVQQHYDTHKADYTEKASVNLRQIRVGVPFQASEAQRAEAKKKIESIAKEANKDNFEAVAKAKSDDEHAKKGGAVGWVARGSLEKPVEEAIDKLAPGQVSGVVSTPYGFYLLQITDKKDAVVTPFESVKTQVAEKLLVAAQKKDWIEAKKKHMDELLAAGKTLDGELKTLKIQTKKTGMFSLGQGYLPNIGQADGMMDAVFELTKQQPVAKKLFPHQDSYYYLKLATMELPKETEFAKEKENLERTLSNEVQGELFRAWVEELQKKAKVKMEVATNKDLPETEQN